MKTKFKVPCEHCGKVSNIEVDENIHQVNERLLVFDAKIATLYKSVNENNETNIAILKEVAKQNKLLQEYQTNPKVLEKIMESAQQFQVKCDRCNFKQSGSFNELSVASCPTCKGQLDLYQVIRPTDNEELFKSHPPTAWEK